MDEQLFPCPSCGFLVFSEPPGSYEICEVCGWEDDHVQLSHPDMRGGANKLSLAEHQQKALQLYPLDTPNMNNYQRSTDWRPLTASDAKSKGTPTDGQSYFQAAGNEATAYYWLKPGAP